ncbi:MAG: phosphatase PAP2 family protein [Lachnospiraceae bacterium]|nr:phosphatase PAP2 family protein [Lachnospiraceae bacterium]
MEEQILLFIQNNIRNPLLDPVMLFITGLCNGGMIWIALIVALLIFKKTRKIGLCCLAALLINAIIVNVIVKPLVGRIRPYEVIEGLICLIGPQKDASFPSGHTAASFSVAVAFFMKAPKKFGIPVVILAVLIAYSRLHVGVHYPTDVLFGAVFGIVAAFFGVFIVDRVFEAIKKKKAGGVSE